MSVLPAWPGQPGHRSAKARVIPMGHCQGSGERVALAGAPQGGEWVAASSSSAMAWWGHGKQLGTKQRGGRRQAVLQGKSPINQEILCCEIAFPLLSKMQMTDKMIFAKRYLSLVMASSRSGEKN